MSAKLFRLSLLAMSIGSTAVCFATDFSGKYEGARLSMDITADGSAYAGQIHLGSQTFPVKAHEDAGKLQGSFTSNGHDFPFVANADGDSLNLVTGGATYALKKAGAPANPLAGPAVDNPLANTPAGDGPAGYTVVNTTDTGKAMSIEKPAAASVQAALEATFPDLAKYFDGRPAIRGAYEDAKDHKTGGASFTASLKGQPVKGIVSCKMGDKGATVAVVYCRTDAPAADWNKLTSAPAPAEANLPPGVKFTDYSFPDGTGSIGLADGWKTNAGSCMNTVVLQGPADQNVAIGFNISVSTPDSQLVQMMQQTARQARSMGMRPPQPPPMLIAPYLEPAEALKQLTPQLSEMSRRNGGFEATLDKILSEEPAKSSVPNGKAALISYIVTRTQNGTSHTYRCTDQIETAPLMQGSWMLFSTGVSAPEATYDKDAPLMMAMIKSMKVNQEVVQEKSREALDAQRQNMANSNQQFQNAQNQRFEAQQQAHRDQMAGYDAHNKAWAAGQVQKSRNNADYVEMIRGYRTVQDTQTGEKTSADYFNVNGIVNSLNEQDPGRYVQIPLRDEMYPVEGGK